MGTCLSKICNTLQGADLNWFRMHFKKRTKVTDLKTSRLRDSLPCAAGRIYDRQSTKKDFRVVNLQSSTWSQFPEAPRKKVPRWMKWLEGFDTETESNDNPICINIWYIYTYIQTPLKESFPKQVFPLPLSCWKRRFKNVWRKLQRVIGLFNVRVLGVLGLH